MIEANPKISVLISIYAKEQPRFFRQAIDSIISQTYKADEIILVKDGQLGKELEKIIAEYQERVTILKVVGLDKNMGLGAALNYGLQFCNNEFVARMDTDDISVPTRFEKQIQYFQTHPHIAVLGSAIYEFTLSPEDSRRIKKVPASLNEVQKYARLRNPVNHPTVIFKKSKVLSGGSYKPMPFFEDFYLWLRILKCGDIIENLNEPLLYFRVGEMFKRRQGINYFKHEIFFFRTLHREKLVNLSQLFLLISVRLPFRILPQRFLGFLYKTFLREND
jgi:glycosyltransferase involved in cell wall biosynthesis